MHFDPRLRISEDAAYEIEVAGFGAGDPPVTVSSAYHVPLACELRDDDLFVRAATGEEVTDMLTTGYFEDGDILDWPGDTPTPLSQEVSWRERPLDELASDTAVRLLSGEVIFKSGQGVAGPFFVHEMAAAAWAFSTAIEHGEETVFECQVIPYACARQLAPRLLREGDAEARRLSRFDVSPLRPRGPPISVPLPA